MPVDREDEAGMVVVSVASGAGGMSGTTELLSALNV